jgi:integrase
MQAKRNARRSYGTGSIIEKGDAYHGQWRVGGKLVKRKLGDKREPGARDGLTRTQAEAALRRTMQETTRAPSAERLSFAEIGERYIRHVQVVMERKPTTVGDYRCMLARHLGPHFAAKPIDRITADDVAAYMAVKAAQGLATKTISNHLNFAHGVFAHAVKRGLATSNPVAAVDRPTASSGDPDVRFLDRSEVEALLRSVPDDRLGPTDRALYVTAAMTGLRQGELAALRWRDVDWTAGVIRVRRSFSRGCLSTPKSRRSTRAVPLPTRVARDLERHFQGSAYQADDDLVFAHPESGYFYDASRMRKRFADALAAAEVRPVRFHDLRHTYGTQMAAAGAPLRTLQGWMGHKSYTTTEVYADFAPDPSQGAMIAERAFGEGINPGIILSDTEAHSESLKPSS